MIDILGERAYNISTRIGGDYMLDVNMIIANNIQAELKKENKKQVDHKNNYRFDNSAENLWWVTPKDNWNYASTEGFRGRDEKGRFCHI